MVFIRYDFGLVILERGNEEWMNCGELSGGSMGGFQSDAFVGTRYGS